MASLNVVLVVCIVWTASVCGKFYQPHQRTGYRNPVRTVGYHPAHGRYNHLNILLAARNKQLRSRYHPQSVSVNAAPYRPTAHYQPQHVNPYHPNPHRRGYQPYSHLNIILAARQKQLNSRYHPKAHSVHDVPHQTNSYQQHPHVNPYHAKTHRRGYQPNRYSHLNIILAAREKQLKARYQPQSVDDASYRPNGYRQTQPVHLRGGYQPDGYSQPNRYQDGRYDPHGSGQHRPVYLSNVYSNPK